LIEEGRDGGGYDVNLDLPGAPLYLQFKRSHKISTRRGIEWKAADQAGTRLDRPYHRFTLMTDTKSRQHDLLLELDSSPNLVFYVAPRYHSIDELNSAWRSSRIAEESVFIRPRDIGVLSPERHAIAFDNTDRRRALVCSEPVEVEVAERFQLLKLISSQLVGSTTPLSQVGQEWFETLIETYRSGRHHHQSRLQDYWEKSSAERGVGVHKVQGDDPSASQFHSVEPPQRWDTFQSELAKEIDDIWSHRTGNHLLDLSLESQRLFGAQLLILQRPS
tara:strand:- start:571 stop:1398 length:828 start_codon:yes stop_codon:yes gene_type:complete